MIDEARTVPALDLPPSLSATLAERAEATGPSTAPALSGAAERTAWRARSTPQATAAQSAAVITAAMRVLALPLRDADAVLAPVVDAARRREPLLLNRVRWTFHGSEGLQSLLRDPRRNTFAAKRLAADSRRGVGVGSAPALDPRTVPAYLTQADYIERFSTLTPQATVRRAIPLLAVRLVTGISVQNAADLLGVQRGSAEMAQIRLARAARAPGEAYALRDAVAALVHDWAADGHRPDLRHRREALAVWRMSEEDWQRLVEPLRDREAQRGGKRVDWASLRLPASVLVWELTTGGEALQAPVAVPGTTSEVRLLRKGACGLLPCLDAYAAALATIVDQTATVRPPLPARCSSAPVPLGSPP